MLVIPNLRYCNYFIAMLVILAFLRCNSKHFDCHYNCHLAIIHNVKILMSVGHIKYVANEVTMLINGTDP
jgi:hypothetical protein